MRYGFLIDNRKCIGCHACTVACKSENRVPLGVNRTWVKYVEKGRFPNTRRYFQAMRCNHCGNAPCVTVCPVGAVFMRRDGIVDFDPGRCIGCKTCMQACPYDAIYVDPESRTAAKCNFCAHRIDNGLEPACVTVCPERAIVVGDLDDPSSEIAGLIARHATRVRKPEQGTKPKLFIIGGDDGELVPTAPRYAPFYMWSQRNPKGGAVRLDDNPLADRDLLASYHVEHLRQWGPRVPLFFWTKAIAAGALVFPAAAMLMGRLPASPKLAFVFSAIAMLMLAVTVFLIVADLTRWTRFYTILLRPQARSWVAWGTVFLVGYSVCGGLMGLAGLMGWEKIILPLCWPALISGIGAAGYTAGLLSQCEGRDFWQNALLPLHFVIGAALAGAALICLLPESLIGFETRPLATGILGTMLIDHLFVLLGLFGMSRASDHATYAVRIILKGPLAPLFWGGVVLVGAIIPALLLLFCSGALPVGIASALLLAGLLAFEWCLVMGGQGVPNS
jgi:Fe-S-cluster-containing dehydrogenase component/formate-dependent nitrite reductase membrane component NrfD